MSRLTNNLKCLPNLIRGISRCENYVSRNYAFKSDLKINWVKPEKIQSYKPEKTGDLGLELNVKPDDLARGIAASTELKDADETVKKLFTLEYLPKWHTHVVRANTTLNIVKRHEHDRGSIEAKLACMTNMIHTMQNYMEEHPRNAVMKVRLQELIDKRKKFLGYLRRWDYKKFEWILEKLNLVYHPHPKQYEPVWRKPSLRKLTDKHCDKLIQDKLAAYRLELESQQKEFYKEKAEKLAFIRKEELLCGLTPTVSEEDIEQANKKYESLK